MKNLSLKRLGIVGLVIALFSLKNLSALRPGEIRKPTPAARPVAVPAAPAQLTPAPGEKLFDVSEIPEIPTDVPSVIDVRLGKFQSEFSELHTYTEIRGLKEAARKRTSDWISKNEPKFIALEKEINLSGNPEQKEIAKEIRRRMDLSKEALAEAARKTQEVAQLTKESLLQKFGKIEGVIGRNIASFNKYKNDLKYKIATTLPPQITRADIDTFYAIKAEIDAIDDPSMAPTKNVAKTRSDELNKYIEEYQEHIVPARVEIPVETIKIKTESHRGAASVEKINELESKFDEILLAADGDTEKINENLGQWATIHGLETLFSNYKIYTTRTSDLEEKWNFIARLIEIKTKLVEIQKEISDFLSKKQKEQSRDRVTISINTEIEKLDNLEKKELEAIKKELKKEIEPKLGQLFPVSNLNLKLSVENILTQIEDVLTLINEKGSRISILGRKASEIYKEAVNAAVESTATSSGVGSGIEEEEFYGETQEEVEERLARKAAGTP